MTIAVRPDPFVALHPALSQQGFFRLSVADYHDMIAKEILSSEDRVELLDGYLVTKTGQKSSHSSTLIRTGRRLDRETPNGYSVRTQVPITLESSEPEPDVAVVRGDDRTYDQRHPLPTEVALIVEVADSSLRLDREVKGPIYARAGIPIYWIVNLSEARVEVYTLPSGPGDDPKYAERKNYSAADSIPLILDGELVASIPVAELLP